ncbi:MAG TPA: alpha/beta hydrolase [Baekduia sp.]|nr:alpha/beta hydrolase [Baekduia sp.]
MSETQTEAPPRNWKYWTEPEFVEIDGLRTAYRRKGSGEPLVFLHGWLHGVALTRSWLPLYDELAKSYDVIVAEHPGFGDTPMPETLHSFSDYVLHYDAFLRELGIDTPHIVGHSFGGWIAADFAIFYPDRVASLSLIAPMGMRVIDDPQTDPFRQMPDNLAVMLFGKEPDKYKDYVEQEGDVEQVVSQYKESIAFARLTWNPRYDLRHDHRLARVTAPTLVIHPADDRYLPRSHSERYAELISDARLEVIEGKDGEEASHLVIAQQPAEVAALVAAHANR